MGTAAVGRGRRHRLAVVEGDDAYRERILLPALSQAGFQVEGMDGALGLYRAMTVHRYDLVLLDAMLSDEDGYSVAAHLRGMSRRIGIVMLTGFGSAHDRLRGLRAGVDAYLHKPVDIETVVATLHNLAYRTGPGGDGAPPLPPGRWSLDEASWRILSPDDTEIAISLAECQVLSTLAATPGVPVSRETLIARLVENVHDFDPHRLETLIHRLRRKCLRSAGRELPLRAVRGIGYALVW